MCTVLLTLYGEGPTVFLGGSPCARGDLLVFPLEFKVIRQADLPEGCLETVCVTDETKEVRDARLSSD